MAQFTVNRRAAMGAGAAALLTPEVALAAAGKRVPNPRTLNRFLSGLVKEGRVAGCLALIWSKGRKAYFGAFGQADREAGRAMSRDTIVQIFSMTKPVTGVALMTLYERGLFQLEDPIAKHLPELADLKVFAGLDDKDRVLMRAPERQPTVIDCMRHTAGLASGETQGKLGALYREASGEGPVKPYPEWLRAVAKIPLEHEPGTAWRYGDSVEIQAALVERLSGKSLGVYMAETIFGPLGMKDTAHRVPDEKRDRYAGMYSRPDGRGPLSRAEPPLDGALNFQPLGREPGGFGLASTADDYMRFARMLLGEGALGETRILKPETVRLMATDHLPAAATDRAWLPGKGRVGFGINFAVRTGPPQADTETYGAIGEFFWDGLATTVFWIDPANDLAAVFLTQVIPYQDALNKDVRDAVYDVTERGSGGS
jgi:CubicO group peptidase (beta-lactamase class C family)